MTVPTPPYTSVTAPATTTDPLYPSFGLNRTGSEDLVSGEVSGIVQAESGDTLQTEDNEYLFEEGV